MSQALFVIERSSHKKPSLPREVRLERHPSYEDAAKSAVKWSTKDHSVMVAGIDDKLAKKMYPKVQIPK